MISRLLFIAILNFTLQYSDAAEWPKPNVDACGFYYRLESLLKCQESGVNYLSDYAPLYCKKFNQASVGWAGSLQSWTTKTRTCLQEKLYEQRSNQDLSCKKLQEIAFKTHSACYNEAELCQLKTKDLIKIFGVIDFKDFIKEIKYSDGGMFSLVKFCIGKHLF